MGQANNANNGWMDKPQKCCVATRSVWFSVEMGKMDGLAQSSSSNEKREALTRKAQLTPVGTSENGHVPAARGVCPTGVRCLGV